MLEAELGTLGTLVLFEAAPLKPEPPLCDAAGAVLAPVPPVEPLGGCMPFAPPLKMPGGWDEELVPDDEPEPGAPEDDDPDDVPAPGVPELVLLDGVEKDPVRDDVDGAFVDGGDVDIDGLDGAVGAVGLLGAVEVGVLALPVAVAA
ncbi:hypothetical protein [Paenibacillus thalictri]|uniref:Uncharacterized protein n=1 Tax=Paenibacillus thalictri TaxID=2527873 RepID=A0A4Q9DY25_9BACL|nr:hypothetical protein [Paenibacillus thalictri]TBL80728.1 hypothetical protein EYB31_05750 [Paenibacillus thalictri]